MLSSKTSLMKTCTKVSCPMWLNNLTKATILEYLRICYWREIFDADLGFRSIGYMLLGRKTELCWTQIWDPAVPFHLDDRMTLFFVLHNAKNLVKLSLSRAKFWNFWETKTTLSPGDQEHKGGSLLSLSRAKFWKFWETTTTLSPGEQEHKGRNLREVKKVEEYIDWWTDFSKHRALKYLVIRETFFLEKMLLKFVSKFPNLEMLDLTFCNNVSYTNIMKLRGMHPKLHDIRLIPHDLSGSIVTPFGHHGSGEIHTYYVDGSFNYARNNYSKGFCRVARMADDSYKVYLEFTEGVNAVVLVRRFPHHILTVNGTSRILEQCTRFPETTSEAGVKRIDKMPCVGGDEGKQPPLKLQRAIAMYEASKNLESTYH